MMDQDYSLSWTKSMIIQSDLIEDITSIIDKDSIQFRKTIRNDEIVKNIEMGNVYVVRVIV